LQKCGSWARFGGPEKSKPMNKLLLVILAILLPPLAVFLKSQNVTTTIINVILCIFFWIPGVIHALWVVLS
jgi:uncharacterized membrane protein YqaE (UPF0057 family)